MAISTRWLARPVTSPAHSPSTIPRPSSSRPSSRKNSIVAARSSTTMPTLSIRLTAMRPIYAPALCLHRAGSPRLLLVREPDELGVECAHQQLALGVRLVELAVPHG